MNLQNKIKLIRGFIMPNACPILKMTAPKLGHIVDHVLMSPQFFGSWLIIFSSDNDLKTKGRIF